MKVSIPRVILTVIVALMFLVFAMVTSAGSYGSTRIFTVGSFNDSIVVQKKMISRTHKIGLYPDAMQKVLFFTVSGENGKVYQLYLFDLEGNLVKQSEIRNKQTTYISDIEQGVYLFDVFSDDDKIGKGQIIVKGERCIVNGE